MSHTHTHFYVVGYFLLYFSLCVEKLSCRFPLVCFLPDAICIRTSRMSSRKARVGNFASLPCFTIALPCSQPQSLLLEHYHFIDFK